MRLLILILVFAAGCKPRQEGAYNLQEAAQPVGMFRLVSEIEQDLRRFSNSDKIVFSPEVRALIVGKPNPLSYFLLQTEIAERARGFVCSFRRMARTSCDSYGDDYITKEARGIFDAYLKNAADDKNLEAIWYLAMEGLSEPNEKGAWLKAFQAELRVDPLDEAKKIKILEQFVTIALLNPYFILKS